MSIMTAGKSTSEIVADLQSSIKVLKENLSNSLVEAVENDAYFPAEQIAREANTIAELEGALQVRFLQLKLEEKNLSRQDSALALLREAVRSPQDTWSGRSGDVARSFADGRRDALDDAQFDLR